MKKNIFIILLLSLTSCKINGSFQGLYSYYHSTKKAKPSLIEKYDAAKACQFENHKKVIVIHHEDLKNCLKQNHKSLIYIWKPKCKSEFCYALNSVQNRCLQNNIELFVVAEYYDAALMDTDYLLKKPLFGIDVEFYNTNLTEKYMNLFVSGITSNQSIEGSFIYFIYGKYEKSFKKINEIDEL